MIEEVGVRDVFERFYQVEEDHGVFSLRDRSLLRTKGGNVCGALRAHTAASKHVRVGVLGLPLFGNREPSTHPNPDVRGKQPDRP